MVDLLIDTNILTYILARNQKYLAFLQTIGDRHLGISIITYIETLVGLKKSKQLQFFNRDIELFEIVPLNQSIGAKKAAYVIQELQIL